MLYDPKWEKQKKVRDKTEGPSLAGFIEWLEKQPPEGEYNWGNCAICACAQYFEGDWNKHDIVQAKDGIRLDGLAIGRPRTYGALLKRARAAELMGPRERDRF